MLETERLDKEKTRSCYIRKVESRVTDKRYCWDYGNAVF